MNTHLIAMILVLISAISAFANPAGVSLNVSIRDFEQAYSNKSTYTQQRFHIIDSLNALPPSFERNLALARNWSTVQVDSAMYHARLAQVSALRQHDKSAVAQATSLLCTLLLHKDADSDAVATFSQIDTTGISRQALIDYHIAGQEMWFTIAHTIPLDTIRTLYQHQGIIHSAAICRMLPPNNPIRNLAEAHKAYVEMHNALMAANLNEVIDNPASTHNQKALAHQLFAIHYERPQNPDSLLSKYHTILAAAEHIRAANARTNIPAKAALMLIKDDTTPIREDALQSELTDALASGSLITAAMCAPYLSRLTDMYSQTIDRQQHIITAIAIIASLLLIALITAARKWQNTHQLLSEKSNTLARVQTKMAVTRKWYITQLLILASSFIENTDDYLRKARRRLSAGQTEDLKSMLKNSKLSDEQHNSFNEIFDATFLESYPNFVNELNSLLLPDKRFELPPNGRLSTDLRIAAFARLGMEDSAQVAQLLDLSLTTVYTYRNKLRARAINRATFYSDLQSQPHISSHNQ